MGVSRSQITAAAFALLRAQGLDALTLRALAAALGIPGAALRREVDGIEQVLDRMAGEMVQSLWQPPRAGQPWEDWLRQNAAGFRAAMLGLRDGARLMIGRRPAPLDGAAHPDHLLAPLMDGGFSVAAARQVLALTGKFTLGWTLDEQAAGAPDDAGFAEALAIVLAGVGTLERAAAEPPPRRQVIAGRLRPLLWAARESGDIAYGRTTRLNEIERQILMLLDRGEGRGSAELAALIGKDKAQISRAVSRLLDQALVRREGARTPLQLAAEGARMAAAMRRLGEARHEELVRGIDAAALAALRTVLADVTRRATALFEQEKAIGQGAAESDWFHGRQVDLPPDPEGGLIVPRLVTLFAYLQRSAALAIKRLLGLTSFEALVLLQVAEHAPLSQQRLIAMLGRDQSQAGKSLKRLIELGLVARKARDGRPLLVPTAEGRSAHDLLTADEWRRDALLTGHLAPEVLAGFVSTLDLLGRNAQAQVEREQSAGG